MGSAYRQSGDFAQARQSFRQAQSPEAEAQRLSHDFPAAEKSVDAIFAQQTMVSNPDQSPDGNR